MMLVRESFLAPRHRAYASRSPLSWTVECLRRYIVAMEVRDALIERLTKRIARMRQALDRFDDAAAEREAVGPNWNVRDLVGHMAFWSDEAATRIQELSAGGASKDYDIKTVNAEVYRKNRNMSFVMLRPQLRAAEDRLLAAIQSAPAKMMLDSPVREWIDQKNKHYDHHWPGLRAAMERLG